MARDCLKQLDQWAYMNGNGVQLDFSRPRRRTDSGLIEASDRRLRQECLNESCFLSLEDARKKIEAWRLDCNREHPFSALGDLAH
jgi:putative transposase